MNLVAMGNYTAPALTESQQLVSDLFHQLSQPLTTLCCALELALLQTPTLEQYGEIVSQALDQAEKASALATAIRELSGAGQPGGSGDLLELRREVEEAIADLLPVAESAGVQVCFAPGPACPVWFDASRLRQGLFHLVGFAIGSGAAVAIELAERAAQAMLGLTISGPGVGGDTPADPGLELWRRLGLGIARAIFEASGGSCRVERSPASLRVEVRILQKQE
jgi:C4-dicarboxylate-specific signal transduction histidine kinase